METLNCNNYCKRNQDAFILIPADMEKTLLLFFIFCNIVKTTLCCPKTCICGNGYIGCIGKQLKRFPASDELNETSSILDFRWNNITNITKRNRENSSFYEVTHLDLRDNQLTVLPDYSVSILSRFPELRRLWLSENKINKIASNAFKALSKLQVLVLSKNKLKNLVSNWFQSLPSLIYLHLDRNEFENVQDSVFGRLNKLKLLNLSGNALKYLPSGTFNTLSSLKELHLADNNISELKGSLTGLAQLVTLDLTLNKLPKIHASWFQPLGSIKKLFLSNNLIASFVPDEYFKWPGSLEELQLRNNQIIGVPPFPESAKAVVDVSGNNIFCGCRRKEHDRKLLTRTLPYLYMCCSDIPELRRTESYANCDPFKYKHFVHYVKSEVCKKPKIAIDDTKGNTCVVEGEPTAVVKETKKCFTLYNFNRLGFQVIQQWGVICEATNIFGYTKKVAILITKPCVEIKICLKPHQ